jgi:hypothetical protein
MFGEVLLLPPLVIEEEEWLWEWLQGKKDSQDDCKKCGRGKFGEVDLAENGKQHQVTLHHRYTYCNTESCLII